MCRAGAYQRMELSRIFATDFMERDMDDRFLSEIIDIIMQYPPLYLCAAHHPWLSANPWLL
jgi:hypothetical protein